MAQIVAIAFPLQGVFIFLYFQYISPCTCKKPQKTAGTAQEIRKQPESKPNARHKSKT